MVRIRLMRMGKRNRPHYRIVVADARAPRDGKFMEILGYYDPLQGEELRLDVDRFEEWLRKGAQPTNRVLRLYERVLRSLREKEKLLETGGDDEREGTDNIDR